MSCPAPIPPLDPLFGRWPAGQVIHVIHDTAFPPESFNPGVDAAGTLRKPTRFAPIRSLEGEVIPYLYGGSTLDCAIFETVFHDVPMDAPDKSVDLDDFGHRGHGELVPNRELIASPSRYHLDTAAWARALHHQFSDIDGLLLMSRQRDRDHALVLFGDRLPGVLTGRRVGGPLARNAALRETVLAAALRTGIEAD